MRRRRRKKNVFRTGFLTMENFLRIISKGKPPGLVVNAEDSRSEPWSSDVGSDPGFT
jgi:hypothetical protein